MVMPEGHKHYDEQEILDALYGAGAQTIKQIQETLEQQDVRMSNNTLRKYLDQLRKTDNITLIKGWPVKYELKKISWEKSL